MSESKRRCEWPGVDELMLAYHDTEWGTPVHDDAVHFEYLVLDAFQAGLSWKTVLHKRENFRKAFDTFDYHTIAKYDDKKVEELLADAGIIRNRLKISATITNAQAFLRVQDEYGSFDAYVWRFVNGDTIHYDLNIGKEVQAVSPESDAMSVDLKKRGFKFVGSTICYAYMQAAGLVNDHAPYCFRHAELKHLAAHP